MTQKDHFSGARARDYDRLHGGTDPRLLRQTVDTLCDLADDGPALEFAIGTGRIALPLAARGLTVRGIELSPDMVAELRKKETGPPLEVVIGDMTQARAPGQYGLVYLVFNTIDNLTTQNEQVACFENAARHLTPGGRFVIETNVPPIQRIPFGETKHAFAATPDHWGTDVIDVATQTYTSNHIWITDGTATALTIPFRYAWPAEMDLMARLAGLDPETRWSDWTRAPFTNTSVRHISVWRKPGA